MFIEPNDLQNAVVVYVDPPSDTRTTSIYRVVQYEFEYVNAFSSDDHVSLKCDEMCKFRALEFPPLKN